MIRLLILGFLALGQATADVQPLPLSSLKSGCHLEKEWFGVTPTRSWATWLSCGGSPMLVLLPSNLTGNVDIRNEKQALELVEFFTSADTFSMFDLDDMLSLGGPSGDEGWSELLSAVQKTGSCKKVEVESVAVPALHEMKTFRIDRCVVKSDQNVYQITEEVRQDGLYRLLSESRVYEDITQFGLYHRRY